MQKNNNDQCEIFKRFQPTVHHVLPEKTFKVFHTHNGENYFTDLNPNLYEEWVELSHNSAALLATFASQFPILILPYYTWIIIYKSCQFQ